MTNSIIFKGSEEELSAQHNLIAQINQLSAVFDNIMNSVETLSNDQELGAAVRNILKPYVIMRNIAKQQINEIHGNQTNG